MAHTVLVIDDDPAVLRLVLATLRDEGFTASGARNGLEALELVGEPRPDAIVLDLEMPVMDGRTFFQELRARGETIPVLLLSAHGARQARHALGAEAAMDKPFDATDLADRLRALVSPNGQHAEAT